VGNGKKGNLTRRKINKTKQQGRGIERTNESTTYAVPSRRVPVPSSYSQRTPHHNQGIPLLSPCAPKPAAAAELGFAPLPPRATQVRTPLPLLLCRSFEVLNCILLLLDRYLGFVGPSARLSVSTSICSVYNLKVSSFEGFTP
jgi:hypothetical protein